MWPCSAPLLWLRLPAALELAAAEPHNCLTPCRMLHAGICSSYRFPHAAVQDWYTRGALEHKASGRLQTLTAPGGADLIQQIAKLALQGQAGTSPGGGHQTADQAMLSLCCRIHAAVCCGKLHGQAKGEPGRGHQATVRGAGPQQGALLRPLAGWRPCYTWWAMPYRPVDIAL